MLGAMVPPHLSNKTRLETEKRPLDALGIVLFPPIYPTKQGLKLERARSSDLARVGVFPPIYPTKQGLKPPLQRLGAPTPVLFPPIYPTKQGLKPNQTEPPHDTKEVPPHLSNKTRLET